MDYETEIIDGRRAVVRHIFKAHEIQVGSKGYVTVEGLNSYGDTDPWIEVVYSWEENGVKKTWQKENFIFQCRYCLIVED
jgi:hypothetical protein